MKTVIRPETEMKDSGIEWIGDIPKDWNSAPIKVNFDIYAGATPSSNNPIYWDGDIAWITPADYKTEDKYVSCGKRHISQDGYDNCSAILVPANSIIFSKRAPIGTVAISKNELCTNQGCLSCVSKDDSNIEFYYYAMSIATEEFELKGSGTTFKEISLANFKNFRFAVPPLSEQQSIADYLDETCSKIDEIIAEAKASIDEYKELRESVISNATTRGIKKNRSMKSSGVEWLPEIPADWNVLSPKVVFTQRKDRAIKGERQLTASQKHGIMYQDDYMKEEGVRIVTVEKDFSILKHVEPDDFVISMRSFQGGLEYSYLRGCISSAYVMLIPNHKYVYSEYYKWFFKSDKYINALQSTSDLIRDGQALRYANFVKLKLFDIPIEEQKEIADYLNKEVPKIDSLITEKESLIKDLESYKKSLIYEVVTGKRKVV